MGLTSKDAVFDVDDPYFASDDFRMFQFKVKRCPRAKPHDWTLCPFAHPGEKAKRRDPLRYRYSGAACPEFRKNGCCRRGDACPFAHGVFECWLHPSRYRTQKCADGPNCTRRVCFFAHEDGELRKAGDDLSYEKPDAPATNGAVGDETLVNHLMSLMKGSSSLASGSPAAVNGGLKPSEPSVFLLAKQKLEKQLQCVQLLEQMQQSAAAGGAPQADLISQWAALQHGAAGPSAVGPSLQPHLAPDGVQGAEAQSSAHLQGAGAIALPGLGLDASMALRGSQMDAVPGARVVQQMQQQLPNGQQDLMAMYLISLMQQQQQQQQQGAGLPLPQAMEEDAGLQIDTRAAKMLQEFMSMQQQQQKQQAPSRSTAAGLTAPPTAADLATTLATAPGASMPGGTFAGAAWMPQLQQAVQRLGSWRPGISGAGKYASEAADGAAAVPHVSPPQEGSVAGQPAATAAALLAASAAPPPQQQQRKQQQEQDRTEFLRQLLQRVPELRAGTGLGDGHADAFSDTSSGAAFHDITSLDARAVGVAPHGGRGAAAPTAAAAETGGGGGGGAAGASSGCAAPPPLDLPAATSSSDGSRDCTAATSPDRLLRERAGPPAMAALQPPSPSGCRSAEPSPVRTPCEQVATGAVREGTDRPLASSGSLQEVWSWIGEQPSSAKGGEALPSHARRDAASPAISLPPPPPPAPAPELAFPSRLLGSGFAAHQEGMVSPAFAAAASAAAAARAGEGPGGELAPDLLLSALQSQLQGMTEQEAQGLAQAALVERSQSFDRLLAELPRSISDMIVDGGAAAAAAAAAAAPAGGGTSQPRPHHPPPDGGKD